MWLHIGTDFGDSTSPVKAVVRLTLDDATGALSLQDSHIDVSRQGTNPGWITRYERHTQSLVTYIAMEDDPGRVQAYSVDEADGSLIPLGSSVDVGIKDLCYATLDSTKTWLFFASYTDGAVGVVNINSDGSVGKQVVCTQQHSFPRSIRLELHDRQEAPHAHCIVPHPSNKWVVSCDLGLSVVFLYQFDSQTGNLTERTPLVLPENAGPRHCVWNADGTMLFINNELDGTVTAASFDNGVLKVVTTLTILPKDVAPDRAHHRGGSDIAIHPNGQYLYAGCRSPSPGCIAIIKISSTGNNVVQLDVIGHESTRGEVPRNFKLIRDEQRGECNWLVVGNQESKTVCSYQVDGATGLLTFASEVSTAPYKPCNIACPSAIFA